MNDILYFINFWLHDKVTEKHSFWRVNVLYFVGIGRQPEKTWRHRESTAPEVFVRNHGNGGINNMAARKPETGNHYRYGNGNMAEQTTTLSLSNHSDFIYSHFLITY